MSDTVTLIVDGIPHELPLVTGTEGERAVDISRLRSTTGLITLDDAYSNTGSCSSAITFIDGERDQVIACPGRDVLTEELLCGAPAQKHGDLVEHTVSRLEEVVLLRQLQRIAQRAPPADDRDLVHGIAVFQYVAHERVPALVEGYGE